MQLVGAFHTRSDGDGPGDSFGDMPPREVAASSRRIAEAAVSSPLMDRYVQLRPLSDRLAASGKWDEWREQILGSRESRPWRPHFRTSRTAWAVLVWLWLPWSRRRVGEERRMMMRLWPQS